MNLVFAASLWSGTEASNGAAPSGKTEDWNPEFPALARRNVLALWEDVPGASDLVPPGLRTFFGSPPLQGPLDAELERRGWVRDETALLGASPEARREAARVSIPLFRVTDAAEAQRLQAEGAENVFASPAQAADAVFKVNAVERRLFPVVTVGGLLFDDGGDVLLVRTRKWSGKWGIPGGKVDYGETLDAAFRREIREETGLVVRESRLVLTQEAVEHPEFYRKRHFVLMNFIGRVEGSHPAVRLNHEGEDYFWGALDTALESTARPLNGPTRVLAETARRAVRAAEEGKESLWASSPSGN